MQLARALEHLPVRSGVWPHAGYIAPLKVLVADDCAINQMIVTALWSRRRITPVIAHDGEQAVRCASAEVFDIILMDIVMPVVGGWEATARIRALECEHTSHPPVPVVAYTTMDIGSIDAQMRRVGKNAALKKPATTNAMFQCLARWCAARWHAPTASAVAR